MHFKERQNREQMMMVSYGTMVAQDNPARLIDLMCRKFIADNPWRKEWKGKEHKGRKSYPPSSMLGLLVYGYFHGISSSRKLEQETHRDIEVLWLMESLQPGHWTICGFRRENKNLIKEYLRASRKFLLDESYVTGKKLVFDGSKIKAYASREMLGQKGIKKKLENIDKPIAEYLSQLESNDLHDNELEKAYDEIEQLKEKVKKLESQKIKLEATSRALKSSAKRQVSPNDPGSVLVKGRDGKFAGYNAQIGVETKEHFIMPSVVTTSTNDQQQLKNCVNSTIEETGTQIEEVLAGKGYGNTAQILDVESKDIQCYIPLPETSREKEEKKGIVFKYDKKSDTYTCPKGKSLVLHIRIKKHHGSIYHVYKCHKCKGCPIQQECTRSKTGRTFTRNLEQEKIDKYKEKPTSNYAKERIAERKEVVEHPFGTIKWLMGKFNFLLKGKEKAQIEFDLYTTVYNIKRLLNCGGTMELMGKIMRYNWQWTKNPIINRNMVEKVLGTWCHYN